ncbi:HMG box family protein [Naegleria gruberi]|uniref:HMG box family protein n=1 Tax=Naegleria gruberi TaxID=5762 RepID=D2VBK5_NAEGR|nr:HMG box family protein [Naegleria gruberi]EFC45812.1 HMG box family protein [Naegleria gruberi]|eukprot:XP_002678556.1 HMG box family protein [Naegleria gruberi strain NEG-M]
MEYLVDALTRAPTQVLVKSATQFGEDAARVLGAAIEESLKNCTEEITTSIKENLRVSGKGISKELDKFSQVFKETAVEGFTEWGIGIERAFYHLGHKLENGLNNTANRLAVQLDTSIENNLSKIDLTVRDSVDVFSKGFLKEQVPHWRNSFMRELNIVMICLLLVSIGIFILCMSWALGGYQIITHILTKEFSTLCFLIFAVINGISLYIWSKSLKEGESSNASVQQQSEEAATPNTKWVRNIITEQHFYYKKNPQLMLIFVGCLSFLMGHLGRDVFSFSSFLTPSSGIVFQALTHLTSWFHILIILILMIAITLIINKILLFQVTLKVYTLWKDWMKFRELMRNDSRIVTSSPIQEDSVKQEVVIERVESVKSHTNIGVGDEVQQPTLPPVRTSLTNIPRISPKSYSSGNIPVRQQSSAEPLSKRAHSGDHLESFNDDSSSDSSEESSSSDSSTEEEEPKITRVGDIPISGAPFLLFCKQNRPKLTQQNPNASFFEVRKKLDEMWMNLSEDEKHVYEEQVEKLKEEL